MYLDLFFPLSLPRPLPDLTEYNKAGILREAGTAYSSEAPEFTPVCWVGFVLLIFLLFVCVCVLPYCVSLRSEFRVVVSAKISA